METKHYLMLFAAVVVGTYLFSQYDNWAQTNTGSTTAGS